MGVMVVKSTEGARWGIERSDMVKTEWVAYMTLESKLRVLTIGMVDVILCGSADSFHDKFCPPHSASTASSHVIPSAHGF